MAKPTVFYCKSLQRLPEKNSKAATRRTSNLRKQCEVSPSQHCWRRNGFGCHSECYSFQDPSKLSAEVETNRLCRVSSVVSSQSANLDDTPLLVTPVISSGHCLLNEPASFVHPIYLSHYIYLHFGDVFLIWYSRHIQAFFWWISHG